LKLYSYKNPFRILLNIVANISSPAGGTHIIVKCLEKRGVKAERPPPGGAAAAINTVFSISFHVNVFLS
jgi:hypothetical protein